MILTVSVYRGEFILATVDTREEAFHEMCRFLAVNHIRSRVTTLLRMMEDPQLIKMDDCEFTYPYSNNYFLQTIHVDKITFFLYSKNMPGSRQESTVPVFTDFVEYVRFVFSDCQDNDPSQQGEFKRNVAFIPTYLADRERRARGKTCH